MLWMVARIAGKLDIDAEEALTYAIRKFRQRFQLMSNSPASKAASSPSPPAPNSAPCGGKPNR